MKSRSEQHRRQRNASIWATATLCAFAVSGCAEMADPLYPDYSTLVGLFVEYETEYTDAAQAFADDPEFVEVYCDGDYREGRTSEDSPFIEFQGDAASRYAEICEPLQLLHMSKSERGIVVYQLMRESKAGKTFVSPFLRPSERAAESETCYLQTRLADTGACDLELSDRWVLTYQWAPTDEIRALLE